MSTDLIYSLQLCTITGLVISCAAVASWSQNKNVSDLVWLHIKTSEAKELVPWKNSKEKKGTERNLMLRIDAPTLLIRRPREYN